MSPSKIGWPVLALLSSTQHSDTAVSWITTSSGSADTVGFGDGEAFGDVRTAVACGVELAETPALADLCPWPSTYLYEAYPMMPSRTTMTIMLRLGERRSLILIGVDGSKTSAAEMLPGVPCSASYSLISGTGSRPTAAATLRMWPRA